MVLGLLVTGLLLASPQGATTVRERTLRDEHKGLWSVVASYPELVASWPLGNFAEASVSRAERTAWSGFLRTAQTEVAELRRRGFKEEYTYESSTRLKFNDRRLLSFTREFYQYTGGAHGFGATRTSNFGLVRGKPRQLSVWDCLERDPSSRRELQFRLLGKAAALEGAQWVEDGDVTEFEERQMENFWVQPGGLVWEFAPYELGPYAAGPFSIVMSWSDLKGLVQRHGPLGFLAFR